MGGLLSYLGDGPSLGDFYINMLRENCVYLSVCLSLSLMMNGSCNLVSVKRDMAADVRFIPRNR